VKYESVVAFKYEVADEVRAQDTSPEAISFYAATEHPMPADMALGVAKKGDEHVLAIRSSDPVAAAAMAARVNGEADVKIITIERRSDSFYSGKHRPLECGLQIGMANKNFVGTLGALVYEADGHLAVISNSHVLADMGTANPGHPFGQPAGFASQDRIGVLSTFLPYSYTAPNIGDVALGRLDKTEAMVGYNGAIVDQMKGSRFLTPDDLGREVFKVGRTTGPRVGRISVVEMDGVQVQMVGGITRWNDQLEIYGPGQDFSAAGDSGSIIVTRDGWAIGLLFAGGRDSGGEDRTYANPLHRVLGLLGAKLAV